MKAPVHPLQDERLAALRDYGVLDTPTEADFDSVVRLAAEICSVPICLISFVDEMRQWFKSEVGLGLRETPLTMSMCSHAILVDDLFEVPDTLADERTRDNPLCLGENPIRFYAGAQLFTTDRLPLGTLCVLDYRPRALTEVQRQTLMVLAAMVVKQLDLRRALDHQVLLAREVDHRVKNSLQMVSSLLGLQRKRAILPETIAALQVAEQRVHAIAALHAELHEAGSGSKLPLEVFVARIAGLVARSSPLKVPIETDLHSALIDSAKAGALAVIVNEFVTNSFKYAFPPGRNGVIRITGRLEENGDYRFVIEDNGVGLPDDVENRPTNGLGLRIMQASAAQLEADFDLHPARPGTRLMVSFRPL